MQRIVFAGDSVTQGAFIMAADGITVATGLTPEQKFASIIGAAKGYTNVVNTGKSGDTVAKLKARLATDVLPHAPAPIVIMIGINDVTSVPSTPIANFRADLEYIVDTLKAAGSPVVIFLPNIVRNTPVGAAFPPYLETMVDVGRAKGVKVLPIYDLFARKWLAVPAATFDALFYDDKHPSALGHQFIANTATSTPYSDIIPVATPDTPPSKKIVFIGDSNTATRPANGINQADTYSQKIGNARGFGTVVNAGIGGQTAIQMLARFQTDVIAQSPDHIHIDGGINGALAGGLTAAQHGAAVRGMAQMCQDAGIPFTLCTPWMVKQTDYLNALDGYNDQVRLVAADFGAPLVDVYEEVMHLAFMNNSGAPFLEKYISGDNQHASVLGHAFRAAIYSKPHNWRACKLPA